MPEGVNPYPRWRGTLASGERWTIVAAEEVREAFRGTWSLAALLLGLGWGLASVIELIQLRQGGTEVHTSEGFLQMLRQLRWFALAVAAAIGGPTLLEDHRRGALELYMSRNLTQRGYLLGKATAVTGLVALTLILPVLLYAAATFVFYDEHPGGWGLAILAGLGYSVLWGVGVAGLALGLSCVSRSSRGAALLLFGGFAGLEIVVSSLLAGLTEEGAWNILSPFAAFDQLESWLFAMDPVHDFPAWLGLVVWVALSIVGWALMVWKHPRVRGEERGGR